jgi:hypothetical protein
MATDRARPDQNNQFSLIAVSSNDGFTPVTLWADPVTHTLVTSGGGSTTAASYITQFYSDSTYTYICKAVPTTALSDASWQIKRLDSSGSKRYAGGAATFVNAATSLAVVGGYLYS